MVLLRKPVPVPIPTVWLRALHGFYHAAPGPWVLPRHFSSLDMRDLGDVFLFVTPWLPHLLLRAETRFLSSGPYVRVYQPFIDLSSLLFGHNFCNITGLECTLMRFAISDSHSKLCLD
jgi:hypothetical protein